MESLTLEIFRSHLDVVVLLEQGVGGTRGKSKPLLTFLLSGLKRKPLPFRLEVDSCQTQNPTTSTQTKLR